MADFTPITTQEEFDKAIQERLSRKDRELADKYKDYLSPNQQEKLRKEYEEKLTKAAEDLKAIQDKQKEHDQTVSDLTKRAQTAENSLLKNQIAYEHKLPLELATRLVGDNKADLEKDAETLASLLKPQGAAPLRTTEVRTGTNNGSVDTGIMDLLSQLSDTLDK
jgi:hypothetical protein